MLHARGVHHSKEDVSNTYKEGGLERGGKKLGGGRIIKKKSTAWATAAAAATGSENK